MLRFRTLAATASVAILFFSPVAALAQGHAAHYVLDAFGGVHAAGGAAAISPATPYFGFDVAADIEYIPVGTAAVAGDGILVLDKFGGVHRGGALVAAPPSGGTPYFGFDAARAIVYRDVPTRAVGASTNTAVGVADSNFFPLQSVTITAPDDGFLLVSASTNAYCTGAGNVRAEIVINVDGSNALDQHFFDVPDCSVGVAEVTGNYGITKLFPVTAGNHTANLLARRTAGTEPANFDSRSITVLFIDQGGTGLSMPIASAETGAPREDRPDER